MSTTAPSPPPTLALVIPCRDEAEVLEETTRRLAAVLERLVARGLVAESPVILYVDDGSRDGTWPLIERLAKASPHVDGLKLSRNFGQQSALFAGLMRARAEVVVSLDADLQDDVEALEAMLEAHGEGYDVVYGARRSREVDPLGKRLSAGLYYRLLRALGVDVVHDHADYRLLSRKALDALASFHEVHLFLRGLVPLLGFQSKVVYYERKERFAGHTKYGTGKMLSLALDGVTSFTSAPLRWIAWLGLFASLTALGLALWALTIKLFGRTAPGWTSIVVPLYFLGGLQILATGVLGIYVSKIYGEVKARPRFIVEAEVSGRERAARQPKSAGVAS